MSSFTNPEVFVALASMPSRVGSLEQVVEALLPQCGKIGVYLNEYDSVPDFLVHPRITVSRSQDHGDQKDNGKFYFLESSELKYYATVDDDIKYPVDYIARLLRNLKYVGDNNAMGVHGFLVPEEVTSITSNRYVFHFGEAAAFLTPAHVVGTGTTIFNQEKWQLRFNEFGQPGMADIWFALAAKKRSANLWVMPRPKSWLTAIAQPESSDGESSASLYDEFKGRDLFQVGLLKDANIRGSWLAFLEQLMSVNIARENFCLTQAMQITNFATRLSWTPPATSEIEHLHKVIQKDKARLVEKAGSPLTKRISNRWIDTYTRTAMEFAVGRVSDAKSLEFVEQLPFLMSDLGDLNVPNCLKWDARPDRQDQLREFIPNRFVATGSNARLKAKLTTADHMLARLSFEHLIELASGGSRSDFLQHPELVQLFETKPEASLELVYRYLNALPDLKSDDLGSFENWNELFKNCTDKEKVQIAYAYLQSKSGNQQVPKEILRELNSKAKFDMETYFLGLRLQSIANDNSQILEAKLSELAEVCGFKNSNRKWKSNPKVSIIVTNFNQAENLQATVDNILTTDYPNFEVIIVDDSSTDESAQVLSKLESSNIKVIHNESNVGPYLSRNAAINKAKGEFIAFHDCGDWSLSERLSVQIEYLLNHPELMAVRTNHIRLDSAGFLGLENNLQFEGDAPVTMVVRKSAFSEIGFFLPTRTRGDIEFLRRLKSFYGNDSLAVVAFPFYLAGPPGNSIKFAPITVRAFTRAAARWHSEFKTNPSLLDPWLIDGLVPFDIPKEIYALND